MELTDYLQLTKSTGVDDYRVYEDENGIYVKYKDQPFYNNNDVINTFGISAEKLQLLYEAGIRNSLLFKFCDYLQQSRLGMMDQLKCSLQTYAAYCGITDEWKTDGFSIDKESGTLIYDLIVITENSDLRAKLGISVETLYREYAKETTLDELVNKYGLKDYDGLHKEALNILLQDIPRKELALELRKGIRPYSYLCSVRRAIENPPVIPVPLGTPVEISYEMLDKLSDTDFIKSVVSTMSIDYLKEDNAFIGARIYMPMCMHLLQRKQQCSLLEKHKKSLYRFSINTMIFNKNVKGITKVVKRVVIDNVVYTRDEQLVITVSFCK